MARTRTTTPKSRKSALSKSASMVGAPPPPLPPPPATDKTREQSAHILALLDKASAQLAIIESYRDNILTLSQYQSDMEASGNAVKASDYEAQIFALEDNAATVENPAAEQASSVLKQLTFYMPGANALYQLQERIDLTAAITDSVDAFYDHRQSWDKDAHFFNPTSQLDLQSARASLQALRKLIPVYAPAEPSSVKINLPKNGSLFGGGGGGGGGGAAPTGSFPVGQQAGPLGGKNGPVTGPNIDLSALKPANAQQAAAKAIEDALLPGKQGTPATDVGGPAVALLPAQVCARISEDQMAWYRSKYGACEGWDQETLRGIQACLDNALVYNRDLPEAADGTRCFTPGKPRDNAPPPQIQPSPPKPVPEAPSYAWAWVLGGLAAAGGLYWYFTKKPGKTE